MFLKMGAVCPSETLVLIYQTAWCRISQDRGLKKRGVQIPDFEAYVLRVPPSYAHIKRQ